MSRQAAGTRLDDPHGWKVVLMGPGPRKIQVIKVVRAWTPTGLKEAKWLVDNVPSVVASLRDVDEADALRSDLEAAGAWAELRGPGEDAGSGDRSTGHGF
jgi:large subunit ribosomal protein L7/L12